MTKKDYIKLAAAVQTATNRVIPRASAEGEYDYSNFNDGARAMRAEIIKALCNTLREDNPNFREDTFREACLA